MLDLLLVYFKCLNQGWKRSDLHIGLYNLYVIHILVYIVQKKSTACQRLNSSSEEHRSPVREVLPGSKTILT